MFPLNPPLLTYKVKTQEASTMVPISIITFNVKRPKPLNAFRDRNSICYSATPCEERWMYLLWQTAFYIENGHLKPRSIYSLVDLLVISWSEPDQLGAECSDTTVYDFILAQALDAMQDFVAL